MSCHHQAHRHHRFWIGSTLLGVAACVAIASLQTSSQSYAASQPALPSAPDSIAIKVQDPASELADWTVVSCNSTHPVLCIYTNRGLASRIEQELATIDRTSVTEQNLVTPEEPEDHSDRSSDTAALKRKIQFLTRLKIWLDTIP